jgi:multiple sugar transport system ATP-binding protein
MSEGTRVELRGIDKRFGSVTALHAVDLAIEPGEFFTLLGPSGSGKSTLLRILAGLEQASGGALLFDGEDVTRVPPWKRQTSMVFQNYALYPHMTVRQNIAYPLKLAKTPAAESDARVREVAEALQIGHLLARKPTQMSGGQQQRVALARALARKPKLFLFDEPLSNLDAKMRLEARTFIKTLQRRLGVTALYVTHDQSEAMALSDRMAILEHGYMRQVGTPREVYRRPADAFVATFVGSPPANLLPGRLEGAHLIIGENSVPRPASDLPDGPVLVGVRPEGLQWVGTPDAPPGPGAASPVDSPPGCVAARVILNEDFGHELLVTVEIAGQQAVLRRTGEFLPEQQGGWVRLDLEAVCLYPPAPATTS